MKKCKYCGGEVIDTAKKCSHCGELIEENNYTGCVYGCLVFFIIGIAFVIFVIFDAIASSWKDLEKEVSKTSIEREIERGIDEWVDLQAFISGKSKNEIKQEMERSTAESKEKTKKANEIMPFLATYKAKYEEIKNKHDSQYYKIKEREDLGLSVENEQKELELLEFKKDKLYSIIYDSFLCCQNPRLIITPLDNIAYKFVDLQKALNQGTITKDEYNEIINKLNKETYFLQYLYARVISLREIPKERFDNTCCHNEVDKVYEINNKITGIRNKTKNFTSCKPSTINTDKRFSYKGFNIDYASKDFTEQLIKGLVDACIQDGAANSQEQLNCCLRSNLYLDKEYERY